MVLVVLLGLLLACAAGIWVVQLLLVTRFRREPRPGPERSDAPVSVLIPVCGLDEDALGNWEAFCRQDHPRYEVLFGVRDPDDPAVPVLESLAARFPERARLVLCPETLGVNHQVSNLLQLRREARYDRILVTDSDMLPEPHYLRAIIAPLDDPAVGLVTCGYYDPAPPSLGAALAVLGRVVDFFPQVLLARALDGELRFGLGATLATRREVLTRARVLETVANRIGTDYHFGRLIAAAGYRVVLSDYLMVTVGAPRASGRYSGGSSAGHERSA